MTETHNNLLHPAPGFVTTIIAQEVNHKLERIFDLLDQVDQTFKEGLPTSLSTLNVALDLNAGYPDNYLTYEQWRTLYQPIMAANQPRPFTPELLNDINPHQIRTLRPQPHDSWVIYPGYIRASNPGTHFLTGVPWRNEGLVVGLEQGDLPQLLAAAREALTNGR